MPETANAPVRPILLIGLGVVLLAGVTAPAVASAESLEAPGDRLAAFMADAEAEGFRGVVLVARDGEILLEEGYGAMGPTDERPIPPDAVFTVGSITKQFTAAAILKLQEMGDLSVEGTLGEHLPDAPAEKRGITLHQLLSHQAGFPGAIGDDRERIGREAFVDRALAVDLVTEPGTEYRYTNVGFSLAAAIVEKVTGESYETFLRKHLFVPAGMVDTGYRLPEWDRDRLAHGWTRDGGDWGTVVENAIDDGGPGWHLLGNGGIHSTARDMQRWHRALQGDEILSRASKEAMYSRHVSEGGGTWYGYGWSIEPTPWGEAVVHDGGNPYFFADYLRFPDADVVVFLATTSRDRRLHDLARPLARIVFTGEVPGLPPAPGPLVEVGSAPAAEEGSAAARWGFPGSFRGERAAELLDALVSDDPAARGEWSAKAFVPELVERRGIDGLVEILGSLAEEAGEIAARGVRPVGDAGVGIVLEPNAERPEMELVLELEAAEPHRIRSIDVRVGG